MDQGPRLTGLSARRLSCWLPDELARRQVRWAARTSLPWVNGQDRGLAEVGRQGCLSQAGASLPSVLLGGSV